MQIEPASHSPRLDYVVNLIDNNSTLNWRRKNNYEWILYRCLFGNVQGIF